MKKFNILFACALLIAHYSLNAASCSYGPSPAPQSKYLSIKDHPTSLDALAVTGCGQIIVGEAGGCIKGWRVSASGLERTFAFHAHVGGVRSLAFYRNLLISDDASGSMYTWDLHALERTHGKGAKPVKEFSSQDATEEASELRVGLPTQRTAFLVRMLNNRVTMFDYVYPPQLFEDPNSLSPMMYELYSTRQALVTRTAINSLCGHWVAYEVVTGEIRLGRAGADTEAVIIKKCGDERVVAMAFSPCGRLLAVGLSNQEVHVWDVHASQCIKSVRTKARVSSVACFGGKPLCGDGHCPPCDSFVAIGLQDGTLYRIPTGFVTES